MTCIAQNAPARHDRVHVVRAAPLVTGPTDAELAQNASLSAGDSWRIWVAVRDAIQPEHPWRYGDDQIIYHYRKDKAHLAACVRALRGAE